MLKYLTHLLRRPVFDLDGTRVAVVHDVIATQGERLPLLAACFVKGRTVEKWVSLSDTRLEERGLVLAAPLASVTHYQPGPEDVRLQRDVLDKQIVDVQGYRVVRVNDVRLAEAGDRLCVVGVDAGLRALVRRTGLGWLIEAACRLLRRPLSAHLISWQDVEPLAPGSVGGGRIRLRVPHEKIARLHPADIADIVEQLDPQQRAEVIESLDVGTAADTLEEMEDEEAAAVMETLAEATAADILDEMEPDEAADLLADLPDERSEELLEHMQPAEAADVKELLAYGQETAGGMMTTEFVAIPATMTADQAIQRLRELAPRAETVYYVYVVDDAQRLAGVLSLRDLIVADPDTHIGDFMVTNVRRVRADEHADQAAHLIGRYNLLALPVVGEGDVLEGIITVDDLVEKLLPPERRRRLPQLTVQDE
ncbi:MAG TPA: CBS domain-containing protein [Chthonomonadales bacterium]|nr:CBS domain-containing protein [Chthonomonadales bacterium]